MKAKKAKMTVDPGRCKGCGLCISVCPAKILELDRSQTNEKGYHVMHNTDTEKCVLCGSCALTCPDGAITLENTEDQEEQR